MKAKSSPKRKVSSRKASSPENRLSEEEVLHLAWYFQRKPFNSFILRHAFAEKYGMNLDFLEGGKPVKCITPLARILWESQRSPLISDATKKQVKYSIMYPPPPDGGWQSYSTQHFTIYYTTKEEAPKEYKVDPLIQSEDISLWMQSSQIIGSVDTGLSDPNYVQKVGIWLEYSLQKYTDFKFKTLTNVFPIQIYLMPLTGAKGFAAYDNYICFLPNLSEEDLNDVPAHELFHLIQYQYLIIFGFDTWYEGTAMVMPDAVSDYRNSWMGVGENIGFNNYAKGSYILKSFPDLSYDSSGFWKYIMEQFTKAISPDEPYVDVIRRCWEFGMRKKDLSMPVLIEAMEAFSPSFMKFSEFIWSDRDLISNETILGNWLIANIAKDLSNPVSDNRFDYIEDEEPPTLPQVWRLILKDCTSLPSSYTLDAWRSRYCEIDLNSITGTVKLTVKVKRSANFSGRPDWLLQILLIDSANNIVDIIKTKSADYQRFFGNPYGTDSNKVNLSRMMLIMASLSTEVIVEPKITQDIPTPDLMITRWNSLPGCEYQKRQKWDLYSEDIWVEGSVTDNKTVMIKPPLAITSGKLCVRVRNKGNASASGVIVRLKYSLRRSSRFEETYPFDDFMPLSKTIKFPGIINANSEAVAWGDWKIKSTPQLYKTIRKDDVLLLRAEIICPQDGSPENNVAMTKINLLKPGP
jgi:hypothetical protein